VEPTPSLEVVLVLAGRLGKAYRSARRDLWRLGKTDDFPEVFSAAAALLQRCGAMLRPTDRSSLAGARRDVRELIEALVVVADCFGDLKKEEAQQTVCAQQHPQADACLVPLAVDPFGKDAFADGDVSETSFTTAVENGEFERELPSQEGKSAALEFGHYGGCGLPAAEVPFSGTQPVVSPLADEDVSELHPRCRAGISRDESDVAGRVDEEKYGPPLRC